MFYGFALFEEFVGMDPLAAYFLLT